MSTSQTSVEAQPIPLAELRHDPRPEPPAHDVETAAATVEGPEGPPPGPDVVDREPATPIFKLLVAGYSFFCAGAGT